ncbi:proteasome maturation factor UMP1 [Atractiella rhizophila]|nr:proteasome maturation factor UMP1 [Atractiella rhizophila]
MEPAYTLVPSTSSNPPASTASTANELGLHDTLRYGPRSLLTEISGKHPLQGRIEKWEETQDNLKLTMMRDLYGIHAPVRLLMERKMASFGTHPLRGSSNIHLDILMGRDESLDVADVLTGEGEQREALDVRAEMEKKMGLDK